RYWQICPIGPTGYGDSPYQLFSGRAGNPYFIDLRELAAAGLLQPSELVALRALPADRVDYGALYANFWTVLARAYDRFASSGASALPGFGSLSDFRCEQACWLEPFADFMALKVQFGGQAWTGWPEEFRQWRAGLRLTLSESV